jgi:ATP-dependent Clp protease protease subunit
MKMRDLFFIIFLVALVVGVFQAFNVAASNGAPDKVYKVELSTKNHVAIRDEVNDATVNKALQGITNSDPNKPFYLFLESPGGSVFAGRRLVNYLQTTDRQIICVANTAISMAFVILEACPVRLMTNHGVLMSHQIASGAKGSLSEMKAALMLTQKLADLYDGMIAYRMGLTLEAYRAKLNPEFWMIGIKDGIDNKAVDAEVRVTCTRELEKAFESFGEGKDAVKVSLCPIAG